MGSINNVSPWAKNVTPNTSVAPELDKIIDRKFATQYLAERLPAPYDNLRNLRHRIGQKIKTAIERGHLKSINGEYTFGDLAHWAQSRADFRQAVADIEIPGSATASLTLTGFTIRASGFSIPTTLTDCQVALADAYQALNAIREENDTLKGVVASLTPLQVKAAARSQAAKIAGEQGGRGNKK